MSLSRSLAVAVVAVVTIAGSTAAEVGPMPSDQPDPPLAEDAPETGFDLWLKGPFGRVVGGTLARPAGAAPDGAPLDAWARGAPLELDQGGEASADVALARLSVRAIPDEGPAAEVEVLSAGSTRFDGPSESGGYVVVAEATDADGIAARRAWRIAVPDRAAPADGLYDIPAPDVTVHAGSESASGWPGNGCYAYLCVEIGRPPPVAALPRLAVDVGETLEVDLSDASSIVAWEGRLEPLDVTAGAAVTADATVDPDIGGRVRLEGLEVPRRGDWLLQLEVVFDRERGQMRSRYRLIAR